MPRCRSLFHYLEIVRRLGLRWCLFRVRYALLKKSGALRRSSPEKTWEQVADSFAADSVEAKLEGLKAALAFRGEAALECGDLSPLSQRGIYHPPRCPSPLASASRVEAALECGAAAPPSYFGGGAASARENLLSEAGAILRGTFRLFGFHERAVGRFPQWNKSPFDGAVAPVDCHWSEMDDFSFGDIKNIWELSRWSWAFVLAGAYAETGDEGFAERFWELAQDWMEKNPANCGVNWRCGQEASFRLFAAVYARVRLDGARATTPERLQQWRRLVRATGERIAANLEYALSQSNNHGTSECAGLLTAGLFVGGAIGRGWVARAEKSLQRQLAQLVSADGGFSQHSAVYHRVVLHTLAWTLWMYKAAERTVPDWLVIAERKLQNFFIALSDKETGRFFLYGANDGANVLPENVWQLENADNGSCASGTEKMALGQAQHFPDAGVFVWTHGGAALFLRCPKEFRHRPSHADLLHIAARWQGRDVLVCPGTFSYNPQDKHFSSGFSGTETHSTAMLSDGSGGWLGQMKKVSRFLYLPWVRGAAGVGRDGAFFEATHFAWKKTFGAEHRRRVLMHEDGCGFDVEDFLYSAQRGWRVHWLLADGELHDEADGVSLVLRENGSRCLMRWECTGFAAPPKVSCVRADANSTRGWHSPHYQEAAPAWSVELLLSAAPKGCLRTSFRFGNAPGSGAKR